MFYQYYIIICIYYLSLFSEQQQFCCKLHMFPPRQRRGSLEIQLVLVSSHQVRSQNHQQNEGKAQRNGLYSPGTPSYRRRYLSTPGSQQLQNTNLLSRHVYPSLAESIRSITHIVVNINEIFG